jgi:hypothetical protein
MLRNLAGSVVVILICAITFAAFYLNMEAAKKRVSVWRRGSTYWFVRSNGLGGDLGRARLLWMERLGYDEAEATIIANYVWSAKRWAFIGNFVLFAIAGAIFQFFKL